MANKCVSIVINMMFANTVVKSQIPIKHGTPTAFLNLCFQGFLDVVTFVELMLFSSVFKQTSLPISADVVDKICMMMTRIACC